MRPSLLRRGHGGGGPTRGPHSWRGTLRRNPHLSPTLSQVSLLPPSAQSARSGFSHKDFRYRKAASCSLDWLSLVHPPSLGVRGYLCVFTRTARWLAHPPVPAEASPDDPVHILPPNPFGAEPGATGGATHRLRRLGSCYFPKPNLSSRTKIRLLGDTKDDPSRDGCSQRRVAASRGG